MTHDPLIDDAAPEGSPVRDLSSRQRMGLIVSVAVILTGLIWTAMSRDRDNLVTLNLDGITPAAQRTLESEFRSAGLQDFQRSGDAILVPESDVHKYAALLPATTNNTNKWAAEWERQNERLTPFSSSRAREATREIARAKLIADMLRQLPDVEAADIVWDEDERRGWRESPKARATVYLMPRPDRALTLDVIRSVRVAVAGSKKNLDPADVVVMDLARQVTYDGDLPTVHGEKLLPALRSIAELHRREVVSQIPELTDVDVSVDLPQFFRFLDAHPEDAAGRLSASAPELLRVAAIARDDVTPPANDAEQFETRLRHDVAALTGIGRDGSAERIEITIPSSVESIAASPPADSRAPFSVPAGWRFPIAAGAVTLGLLLLISVPAACRRRRAASCTFPVLSDVNGSARRISVGVLSDFEDLRQLRSIDLQTVFPHATPRRWAVALRGSSSDLLEHLAAALDPRDAAEFRQQNDELGPVTLGDIDSSRQRILQSIQTAHAPAA